MTLINIQLSEPANPKYLYVDEDNTVHLFIPITSGYTINLDNTCKTVLALQEFFGKRADSSTLKNSALDELKRYRNALSEDLKLVEDEKEIKLIQDRLAQVILYIRLLEALENHPDINSALRGGHPKYPAAINTLFEHPESNLYSMQLRPTYLDNFLNTKKPVFTVNRQENSPLYNSLNTLCNKSVWINDKARTYPFTSENKLSDTLTSLSQHCGFSITEEQKEGIGLSYDDGLDTEIKQADISELIEAIINAVNSTSNENTDQSPYDSIKVPTNTLDLPIITQFLLAEINIYARSKKRTTSDFGKILDANPNLSEQLKLTLSSALEQRQFQDKANFVERKICLFFNQNKGIFGFEKDFSEEDIQTISERFKSEYSTIAESPHMDEFMLLDYTSKSNPLFYSHQNNICCNFKDFLKASEKKTTPLSNRPDAENKIPCVIQSKDSNTIKFVSVDEDTFKTDITIAIFTNNFEKAKKILSKSEKREDPKPGDPENIHIFEKLGREYFKQFDSNTDAQKLFKQLRASILDAKVSNKFNQIVRGQDAQLLLTPITARSIYVAVLDRQQVSAPETLKYNTPEDLTRLIKSLFSHPDIQADARKFLQERQKSPDAYGTFNNLNISLSSGYDGNIIIDGPSEIVAFLVEITKRYEKSIHVSTVMAQSIYQHLETTLGKENPSFKDMNSDNNNKGDGVPYKFNKALNLLGIDPKYHACRYNNTINSKQFPNPKDPMGVPERKGGSGFILNNVTSEELRLIEEIAEEYGNKFKFTATIKEAIFKVIKTLDTASFNELTNYRESADKLEVALSLLGIEYRSVQSNLNGEYTVFMPPSEQAKIKFILCQLSHDVFFKAYSIQDLNKFDAEYVKGYRAKVQQPEEKTSRAHMINEARARARQKAQAEEGITSVLPIHSADAQQRQEELALQALATQTLASQTLASQTQATQAPTPQTLAPQTQATQTQATQAPTPQTQATQTLATQAPTPQTPTPQTLATQTLATQTLATQAPTPQTLATQTLATQTQATPALATQALAPQAPTPQALATQEKQPVNKEPREETKQAISGLLESLVNNITKKNNGRSSIFTLNIKKKVMLLNLANEVLKNDLLSEEHFSALLVYIETISMQKRNPLSVSIFFKPHSLYEFKEFFTTKNLGVNESQIAFSKNELDTLYSISKEYTPFVSSQHLIQLIHKKTANQKSYQNPSGPGSTE